LEFLDKVLVNLLSRLWRTII